MSTCVPLAREHQGNEDAEGSRLLGCSARTITDRTNYLRESVASDILTNDECVIGGPGIYFEIDASQFGKRNAHVSVTNIVGRFADWAQMHTSISF